jgi:site-specific recombinase XerD
LEALGGGAEAIEFVEWLVACGRSSYTVRTYASGLAHFLGWLEGRRAGLVEVDRGVVADYVPELARGERDGVAVGRAPATGQSPGERARLVLRLAPRAGS